MKPTCCYRPAVKCLLILCLWLIAALPAINAEPNQPEEKPDLEFYTQQLEQAEQAFSEYSGDDTEVLDEIAADILDLTPFAKSCISEQEQRLKEIKAAADRAQGNNPQNAIEELPESIKKDRENAEQRLKTCNDLDFRASRLQDDVRDRRQSIVQTRLFARQQSLVDHVLVLLAAPASVQAAGQQIWSTLTTLPLNWKHLYWAAFYGLAGMLTGLFWSVYKRHQSKHQASKLIHTSPALATVWNSTIRVMPFLLMFGLINLSFRFAEPGLPAIVHLAQALLVFTISYAILHAMLRPRQRLSGFRPLLATTSRKLFFWGQILLFTTLLGALFQSGLFDSEATQHLISVLRIMLGTFIGLALARVLWLLRNHLSTVGQLRMHYLGIGLIIVAIGALWAGYSNFSAYLFRSLFGTLFILLLGWLLIRIPVEIFDGLDESHAPWQRKLRQKMGLDDEQIVPGLVWLRLAHVLLVWGAIIVALLRLWGVSEQSFNLLLSNITTGFEIGDFKLEPLRILWGLLLMAFLIVVVQLLKRNLSQTWLRRTSLSRGAREATVTITGYVGMALAAFIGLSAAGLDFSNFALIAGALSVGIGFGLQNIVSNFISGIILLFERPIRRGDWIQVGAAEGYVKDISIRSTVIETFDRSDIIVPNSELIANQVTNMVLNNQNGRIIIPLRVAYGADTEQIMSLLHEVAENHPAVLRERSELQAQVLFRSFGDTAMHFELRCYIRDVEAILPVTSELNLAVDKALRAAGIKIPLPQQIVYLHKNPETGTETTGIIVKD